jgi:hypothetical protein
MVKTCESVTIKKTCEVSKETCDRGNTGSEPSEAILKKSFISQFVSETCSTLTKIF